MSGARFVLETRSGAACVCGYPPRTELESTLAWEGERACFDPPLPAGWAADEATKLARVLHRTPATRLVRWRGP